MSQLTSLREKDRASKRLAQTMPRWIPQLNGNVIALQKQRRMIDTTPAMWSEGIREMCWQTYLRGDGSDATELLPIMPKSSVFVK